jgi:CubicO group peptidase (beta-lactamase class C family)
MEISQRRLLGLLLLILFSVISACSQTVEIKKLNGEAISSSEVDKVVNELMDAANVTGLCLAVLNENELAYVKTFGYKNRAKNELLDENSIILGASFSKVVFTYVVMQLIQENMLALDKPLYTYLSKPLPEYDDYKDLATDDQWKLLTARTCLSHTTGFPNLRALNPRGNGKLEFWFKPGTRYAYSGEGIELLQFVVEQVTNKGLEELAVERVFKPLGMDRTSFVWQERFEDNFADGHDITGYPMKYIGRWKNASGGGSLLTSIADYARFIRAIMQGKGLDESTWNAMLSPSIRIKSKHQFPTLSNETTDKYDSIELSYGLGWGLFASEYGKAFFKEGHGPGWQNYNVNFIDQKTSIVIMTNSDNGEKIFKDLLEKAIGDTFTPWEWEGYIPYYLTEPISIGRYLYDILMFQHVDKAIETYRRISVSSSRNSFVFDESQLNGLGYQMIREGKLEVAVSLFKLNVEEYPESANAYDSLGEAYKRIGQIDLAIESYERSMELNPENDNAREMLRQLKGGK